METFMGLTLNPWMFQSGQNPCVDSRDLVPYDSLVVSEKAGGKLYWQGEYNDVHAQKGT